MEVAACGNTRIEEFKKRFTEDKFDGIFATQQDILETTKRLKESAGRESWTWTLRYAEDLKKHEEKLANQKQFLRNAILIMQEIDDLAAAKVQTV